VITYKVNECFAGNAMHPMLEYSLDPVEQGLVFQIQNQSPLVTNFLQKNKFRASNGLTVDVSEYPEYKESALTIFLRGGNAYYNTKPDGTGFYSNLVRDSRKRMIDQALKELVAQVKRQSQWNPWNRGYQFPGYIPAPKEYTCFPIF